MEKIKKSICTLIIFIFIFTFISFIVVAQGAEQPIDCLLCFNMTTTPIVQSEDLNIMGYDSKGIVIDNTQSKFFDNATVHIVGLMKIDKGKLNNIFAGKYLDPNGDFYVIESSQPDTGFDWRFIYGTGKFKGITGAGKSHRITKGKPITPGTSQYCIKVTGNYELKK